MPIVNKIISLTVTLLVIFTSCSSTLESDFIGSWRLQTWTGVDSSGVMKYPYGEDALGALIYTENGAVTLTLSHNNRVPFGTNDRSSVPVETIAEAFNTYFSYHGTFRINEIDRNVVHHISFCTNPDWIGKEQLRSFEFKGDQLILRAENVIGLQHELIWIKD